MPLWILLLLAFFVVLEFPTFVYLGLLGSESQLPELSYFEFLAQWKSVYDGTTYEPFPITDYIGGNLAVTYIGIGFIHQVLVSRKFAYFLQRREYLLYEESKRNSAMIGIEMPNWLRPSPSTPQIEAIVNAFIYSIVATPIWPLFLFWNIKYKLVLP